MMMRGARMAEYRRKNIENVYDLFKYIAATLKTEFCKQDEKYLINTGGLFVDYSASQDGDNIAENLRIHQQWQDDIYEETKYQSAHMEPSAWKRKEMESLRGDPRLDEDYKQHIKDGGEPYLNIEEFLNNISFCQFPDTKIAYCANNMGRGIKTLHDLKLPSVRSEFPGASSFKLIFLNIVHDADPNREDPFREQKIKEGRFEKSGYFSWESEGCDAPQHMAVILSKLCRYYVGDLPKGICAD